MTTPETIALAAWWTWVYFQLIVPMVLLWVLWWKGGQHVRR